MSDIFREVEEDIRRDRYAALWKKYGDYVVALVAVLVLGAAGLEIWRYWERSAREEAARDFHAAVQTAESGNAIAATKDFAKLAEEGPAGYAMLAKFHEAGQLIVQGKREEAIAIFRTLAQSRDSMLSGAARVRLAWALADFAPREEIETVVAPLTDPNSAWRFLAREVLAYTAYRTGSAKEAAESYAALAAEQDAPEGVRTRASAMAEYIKASEGFTP